MKSNTHKLQSDFVQTVKGGISDLNGVERPDRIHHYQRLIKNIFKDVLESAYPITHKILGDEKYTELISDFLLCYSCHDPQYWRMPYEFKLYLEQTALIDHNEHSYLSELLNFEWLEIEIHSQQDTKVKLRQGEIVLNPYAELLELEYPVFKHSSHSQLKKGGPFYLIIYRDLEKLNVQFCELNSMSYQLLYSLKGVPQDKNAYCELIVDSTDANSRSTIKNQLNNFIKSMLDKGILIDYSLT